MLMDRFENGDGIERDRRRRRQDKKREASRDGHGSGNPIIDRLDNYIFPKDTKFFYHQSQILKSNASRSPSIQDYFRIAVSTSKSCTYRQPFIRDPPFFSNEAKSAILLDTTLLEDALESITF